jgi:hypothetical protein
MNSDTKSESERPRRYATMCPFARISPPTVMFKGTFLTRFLGAGMMGEDDQRPRVIRRVERDQMLNPRG